MNIKRNIQASGRRFTSLVALLAVTGGLLYGQHTLTLGQHLSCENNSLLIPMHVSAFENVGSFTLFIEIDTLNVTFDGLVNPHTSLSGGSLVYNFMPANSSIVITWFSIGGVSIPEGTLLEMKLMYQQNMADLTFSPNCELADPQGEEISDVVYEDGMIVPAIEFALQPQPQTVTQGEQAYFLIEMQHNDEQTFLWQQHNGQQWTDLADDDHFTGVHTAQLTIDDVPLSFNNTAYRCKVDFDICSSFSDSAALSVSPLTVVNPAGNGYPVLKVWPNPFTEKLHYEVNNTGNNCRLHLINMMGETVEVISLQSFTGVFYPADLPTGIYFLQLTGNTAMRETIKIIKQ